MVTKIKTSSLLLSGIIVFLSGIFACFYLFKRFEHVFLEDSLVFRIVLVRQSMKPLDLLIGVVLLAFVCIEILIVALLLRRLGEGNSSEGNVPRREHG
jgi:divalent metal cation (Fe/Co/Zn/Cd) transporter